MVRKVFVLHCSWSKVSYALEHISYDFGQKAIKLAFFLPKYFVSFVDICKFEGFEFGSAMTERKPKVLVFDLDYTLWPFWVDTHVTPPFRKGKGKEVVDAHGKKIKYYEEVPEVLKELNEKGYEIGVASRTSEIQGAYQLLKLFGWEKYIKYTEIYPGCKVKHFSKIQKNSGVDYKDMIFFDDEHRNIHDLTEVGVLSILVKDGVTKKVIEEGLRKFASQ